MISARSTALQRAKTARMNRLTGHHHRVHVLPIVTEGHPLLSKTNSVLARRDAVECLEVGLGDATQGEVDVDAVWLGSFWNGRGRESQLM